MKQLSMKKKIFLVSSLLVVIVLFNEIMAQRLVESAAYNSMLKKLLNHTVTEKSVQFVHNLISESKSSHIQILDAREKNEYNVSHIENSIWVGYNDFDLSRVKSLNKNDTIIVYCSVGYRSEKIAEKLKTNGFKFVFNTYGGIFEWVNQKFPIVDNNSEQTKRVHAYSIAWGVWVKECEKVYD